MTLAALDRFTGLSSSSSHQEGRGRLFSAPDAPTDLPERPLSAISRRSLILDIPYGDLPSPWDEPPQDADTQPINFTKLMQSNALQKFDGTTVNYEYFRTDFCACVHSQNVQVVYKLRALIWCVKDAINVQDLLHTMGTAPAEGYVQVILYLENHFGGSSRIIHEAE